MEEQKTTYMVRNDVSSLYAFLRRALAGMVTYEEVRRLRLMVNRGVEAGLLGVNRFGIHTIISAMSTAKTLCESIVVDRNMVLAIIISPLVRAKVISETEVARDWGDDVAKMTHGLVKIAQIYSKSASVESENFRNLLLTFADDIRVIIIMLVDRLALMRDINHHPAENLVRDTAYEANYLYAPLAHRLGLYAIKSELEDMSLKYSNREVYTRIANELNETKAGREAYIAEFIAPLKEKLQAEGLKFEIKGRTKSIYSIWNKIKKQNTEVKDIYDLFAIRIIIDCDREREKQECWQAYSVVTDLYRANTSRLKDWIAIPKSNGYESLHITVYGPDGRWVEVQIRTRRMDLIAEKGLAAHWRYKGIKSEGNLDDWMKNIRDILETAETGPMELIKNFKMDVYSHEVFVFTPKGDLYKLPLGATLLDFAFNIHSNIGVHCTGGRVDGRNRKLNYRLNSGDTVEIFTSPNQEPSRDWLSIVVTSKAKNKIRAVIKEAENRSAEFGKELIQRRFKNRKIDIDEAIMSKTITRLGYKTNISFYDAISAEDLDVNDVVETYLSIIAKTTEAETIVSAAEYTLNPLEDDDSYGSDVIVIGDNIKGINYKLAKCCNPIYGDNVFGFISSEGVIKIHRIDCPNSTHIRNKYGYRLINVRWSGKGSTQFPATIHVVGKDDIGIVTNITSIINKENSVSLRGISIDSNDGIFQGNLIVGVNDTEALKQLIKKISTVKGVKNVQRSK